MKQLLYVLYIFSTLAFSMESSYEKEVIIIKDFFGAIQRKDPFSVKEILDKHKKIININSCTDSHGRKPLSCMVLSKSLMGLSLLIDYYHPDVNIRDATKSQFCPLQHAINLEWQEGVVTLLKAGADPNIRDTQGFTAIQNALIQNTESSIQLALLDKSDLNQVGSLLNFNLLHFAAAINNIHVTPFLLEHNKTLLNKELTTGFTPLQIAIKARSVEVFFLLIRAGAHIEIENIDGQRAIHLATVAQNATMLDKLAENADLNAQNNKGDTALHIAGILKWNTGIRLLQKYGARDNIENKKGITAHELIDVNSVYNQFLRFTSSQKTD